ncbi:glycine zipper domain-containing protein [Vibrio vulnificus]|nr:glycine zipper domain-containing protein [Vibrio vulnificus]
MACVAIAFNQGDISGGIALFHIYNIGKYMMKNNALSVYDPLVKKPNKYEVEFSVEGAKRGCVIGAMIGSKVPHPLGTPVGVVVGGFIGAVFGKVD